MEKLIIYQQDNGILAEVFPTGALSLKETAEQIVPTGVKYKFINYTDLPKDQTFRDAWEFDFSKDSDGVGA
tara:strand:- start:550 stop:762 length:213 start_codon:yes stop_codon:yes gene_type:complete